MTEENEDVQDRTKSHSEQVPVICQPTKLKDGEPYLFFGGPHFPSWPNVSFGFRLKPGATEAQAKALAAHIL